MIFRHSGFHVEHLKRAIEWYKPLGFTVLATSEEDWGRLHLSICKMEAEDKSGVIELIQSAGDWPHHIAVSVPSISAVSARCDYKGKRRGNVQYIRDPWGNAIELVEVE